MITNLLEILLSTIKTTPSRNFRPTVVGLFLQILERTRLDTIVHQVRR